MTLRKILYPTKFRDLSLQALKELLALKKIGLEEVIVVHLIPREEVSFDVISGFLKEEVKRLMEEVDCKLDFWEREVGKAGISLKRIVKVGDPVFDIPQLAEEEKVDLVVVGKKTRTRIFTSSRTKEILQQLKVPALVFKYKILQEEEEIINQKIFSSPLLALDFSPPSLRALSLLSTIFPLAERAAILHVISPERSKELGEENFEILKKTFEKKMDEVLNPFALLQERVEKIVLYGEPQRVVFETLKEWRASLVILGRSEKTFVDRLFLGSVTSYVLDHDYLPVLIVP